MTVKSLFYLPLYWLDDFERVKVEFSDPLTRASPFKLFFRCERAGCWWITASGVTQAKLLDETFFLPEVERSISLETDSLNLRPKPQPWLILRMSPGRWGRWGRKQAKLAAGSHLWHRIRARDLMRTSVGSGGLSSGAVTNRQLCRRDDEQRGPKPRG